LRRWAAALPWVAAGVVVLAAGIWLGGHPSWLPDPVRDAFVDPDASLTNEATDEIKNNYWRAPSGELLRNSSVDGMIEALRKRYHDRFSHYFSPRDFKKFQDLTSGEFSGVGMSVREIKRGLRVTDVFANTPARAAGIRKGDEVIAVNGRSIAGKDAELTTAEIKGPEGTTVKLTVVRPSTGAKRVRTVKRARIEVPVVKGAMKSVGGKPVGYVRLSTFSRGSHAALRSEVDRLYEKGAEGLVLDLRANGGGLLAESVLDASVFLPGGETVVSTSGRKQPTRVYRAFGDPVDRRPMVVLIDHDTASAAEILTAALEDHEYATVVGTRSFGKGVFQEVIPLGNGGALDLTVGEYLTPDGTSLAGKGIRPQVPARDLPGTKADEGLLKALGVLGQEL
jgi:carboxyl-terminal processing protease